MSKSKVESEMSPPTLPWVINPILAALLPLWLTLGILVAVSFIHMVEGVTQILIIIAGMLTANSVNSLQELFQALISRKRDTIRFPSEYELTALLPETKTGTDHSLGTQRAERSDESRRLTELLAIDPNAALARLRMDIEADLHHLALANEIDVKNRPLSASKLVDILRDDLDQNLQLVLKEILSACNRAIHGFSIDQETAARVLDTGIRVRSYLANRTGKVTNEA